jgi:RimJ/RimL family protein N-acetyltransferase
MNSPQITSAPPSYGPPPVALKAEGAAPSGVVCHGEIVVLTRALAERDWDMVRAFVRGTSRESLRLRFGQAADFTDDRTLKRFFDIKSPNGEMMWMLEEGGAICAIVHLARLSPGQAEIALIVRSDRARRGIGEALLRTALARAARQGLRTLSAVVLHENTAMLRLARKAGFVPCKSLGLAVELEFDLRRDFPHGAGAVVVYSPAIQVAAIASGSAPQ